ncbi:CobW family GTP-binding protein [Bacillus solitudinis]|uniref:CobW family GTP-binding protein n=1 Tax=Bacillus solitudinis TaxID=2014074 RepID=UPI000C23D9E2|nr:GTP-binding protein [Bacillus solitudinis]
MEKRIPTYLFSGFLGSGKTTVLKQVLANLKEQGKKSVIVFNELGEENVEKSLFQDDTMLELLNGCICCTIQEDMRVELRFFLEDNPNVDVVLIEGTGIANPTEVIDVLTHPELFDKVEIMSVISVIDTSHYLEYQSLFASSKEIRNMLKQQITSSSLLLLNKIDLIDEQKLNKVKKKVDALKQEQTPMIETVFGETSFDQLLKKRINMEYVDVSEEKSHHHHHHPFQAIKVTGFHAINQRQFEAWLQQQGDRLLRAKGFIQLEGSNQLFSFQYASKRLEVTPVDKGEHCVILIGTELQEERLKAGFLKEFSSFRAK